MRAAQRPDADVGCLPKIGRSAGAIVDTRRALGRRWTAQGRLNALHLNADHDAYGQTGANGTLRLKLARMADVVDAPDSRTTVRRRQRVPAREHGILEAKSTPVKALMRSTTCISWCERALAGPEGRGRPGPRRLWSAWVPEPLIQPARLILWAEKAVLLHRNPQMPVHQGDVVEILG
jgi:hypothetical protein